MNNINDLREEINNIFSNCKIDDNGKVKASDFIDVIVLKYPDYLRDSLKEEISRKLDFDGSNPSYKKQDLEEIFNTWVNSETTSPPSNSLKKEISRKLDFDCSNPSYKKQDLEEVFNTWVNSETTSPPSSPDWFGCTFSTSTLNQRFSRPKRATKVPVTPEEDLDLQYSGCHEETDKASSSPFFKLQFELKKYQELQKTFNELLESNEGLEKEFNNIKKENAKLIHENRANALLLANYKQSLKDCELSSNIIRASVKTQSDKATSIYGISVKTQTERVESVLRKSVKTQTAEQVSFYRCNRKSIVTQTDIIDSCQRTSVETQTNREESAHYRTSVETQTNRQECEIRTSVETQTNKQEYESRDLIKTHADWAGSVLRFSV